MQQNYIYFNGYVPTPQPVKKENKILFTILTFFKDAMGCIIMLTLTILMSNFLATATVDGLSMYPTYNDQDLLLIFKTTDVDYGDVVTIWSDNLNEYLCKRVIGMPGDNIKISDGRLYLNGNLYMESYIREKMTEEYNIDIVVEPDKVFVMGDNRNVSLDSRELGAIPKDNIVGVSVLNVTKKLHINKFYMLKFVCALWIIFIIYTVINDVIPYIKKRKDSKI